MNSTKPKQFRPHSRRWATARQWMKTPTWSKLCLVAAAFLAAPATASALIDDGEKDESFVAIHAGRIITVSGEEIKGGTIVLADGKIRLIGRDLDYPENAKEIDARDQVVMPGMIDARTRLELPGYNRAGVNGNQLAARELEFAHLDFEDYWRAGFTSVCVIPDGTGAPGQSCLIRLSSDGAKDRIDDAAYVLVTMSNLGRDKPILEDAFKKAKAELEKIRKAREEWEKKQKEKAEAAKKAEGQPPKPGEAPKPGEQPRPNEPPKPGGQAFDGPPGPPAPPSGGDPKAQEKKEEEKFTPPKTDEHYQPFMDLLEKKEGAAPLLIELAGAGGWPHLLDVLKPYEEVPHSIYLSVRPGGTSDFLYLIDKLKGKKVLLPAGWLYQPNTVHLYALAAELARAGAEVSFSPPGGSRDDLADHLRQAAELRRVGMDREAILKALTLNPARLLGVDKRLGSLEKDKEGDLIFLSGDPLDPLTRVERVMVLGEVVWAAEEGGTP